MLIIKLGQLANYRSLMHTISVPEITAGHWPFSDQFPHLANQNPFWSAKFTVHFQWEGHQLSIKCPIFQKTADQFLTLIYTTAI